MVEMATEEACYCYLTQMMEVVEAAISVAKHGKTPTSTLFSKDS